MKELSLCKTANASRATETAMIDSVKEGRRYEVVSDVLDVSFSIASKCSPAPGLICFMK